MIAICAVICGAETWVAVELLGQSKLAWLKRFLEVPNGIPSPDTFGRVFGLLEPVEFQPGFLRWVQALTHVTQGPVMGGEGQPLRGSHDKRLGKAAIFRVSAWASEAQVVLGQRKVDDNSNEMTAIRPQSLEAGKDGQGWDQSQAPSMWLERAVFTEGLGRLVRLPCQIWV